MNLSRPDGAKSPGQVRDTALTDMATTDSQIIGGLFTHNTSVRYTSFLKADSINMRVSSARRLAKGLSLLRLM